jgi:uncharacterized membrane protein
MRRRLIAMFEESDGSQWLFLSGLVLGFAGNLVIWAFAPVPPQSNWKRLLFSGVCFALGSACFSIQGWILKRLEYLARAQAEPSGRPYTKIKNLLVNASLARLVWVALLGLSFTLAGLVSIALSSSKL